MAIRNYKSASRACRNSRCDSHNSNRYNYKYLIGLLAVIFTAPALANESTSVSANPQAAITGSVANQAVQINQGTLSTQSFGGGIHCNGAVLSITPYYLTTENYGSTYSNSNNSGAQVSISVPLNGGSVERCKALAQLQIDKTRLDYELIRVKECIAIYERGFTIHPSSPFYPLCADVIPIAALPKLEQGVSLED
jgi:hypothetical protein